MNHARLGIIMLVSALLSMPLRAADELILRSGKVVHGTITAEDKDSYTVRVRANMSLNVSKSDVARVMREPPPEAPKPHHPVRTKVETPRTASAPSPAPGAPATSVSAVVPVAPVAPPAVQTAVPSPVSKKKVPFVRSHRAKPAHAVAPAKEPAVEAPATPATEEGSTPTEDKTPVTVSPELPGTSKTVGVVTLNQSMMKAFYTVSGQTFETAMRAITDSVRGKGFLVRGLRRPSRTQWRLSWYGTPVAGGTSWASLTLNAVITTTLPAWEPRKDPDGLAARRWDAVLKECNDVERTHTRLIEEGMSDFATEASNLTAANEEELRIETGKLLSDARARSDKRRKGYDRRRTEMKRVIRKKPLHK